MADCSKLSRTLTRIAMNIGSRDGINTIDDVLDEMQKQFPVLTRQSLIDAIVEATTRDKKEASALSKKLTAIKQEARTDKKLRKKISELQEYLDKGELPPKALRNKKTVSPVIEQLREIRDGLKKEISGSVPARKKRLQDSINKLEERIRAGDFMPAQKAEYAFNKEIADLEYKKKRLQRKIRAEIHRLKPKTIWEHIASPFNAARSLITSIDLSGVLRQGGFIVLAHPVRGAKLIPKMLKAFASDRAATDINEEILSRANAPLYAQSKLFLAPLDGTEKLSQREEVFMTDLIERLAESKIPVVRQLGQLVAGSERAYITYLNMLRADSFDTMVGAFSKGGQANQKEAEAIANFINIATGRGDMGNADQSAVVLNTIFFAPRYSVSRFQLLLGQPLLKGTAQTRKAIATEYARYLIGLGLVYALGLAAGGDVEDDPNSSDFGKIRFGNTRLDPLSGMAQVTVLLSRIRSGVLKSTTSGKEYKLRGEDKRYGGPDVSKIVGSFLRYKFSPMLSAATNIVTGEGPIGEKTTPRTVARDLTIPLALRDVFEAMKDQGVPAGTAMSILAIFGVGLQTYSPKANKAKSTSPMITIEPPIRKRPQPVRTRPNNKRKR